MDNQTANLPTQTDSIPNDPISQDTTDRNQIDVSRAFKLRAVNRLSYGEIAKQLNCSKSGVYDALQPFLKLIDNPNEVQAYVQNKEFVFNALEWELVKDLTDEDKRKKASLNNTAFTFNTVANQNRLEQGKATANIANIHEISLTIKEAQEQIERAKQELYGD